MLLSVARIIILTPVFLGLSGCDLKIPSFSSGQDESDRLSPRVVQPGQPVPKGGGRYKVGSPYRINGKLFVPREVAHYEETGVASWYGELFHGRRTANGEVYDMEALSAAHPTLPLPSYVRVTNLRNGRSVVLRVNDRGPYSRGRLIDLSWGAASLLKMARAGTAPVRVEYLGRAPLNGSDRYERDFLARQPWAGPQIAYAKSPGKAARQFRSLQAQASSVNRDDKEPVSVASVTPSRSNSKRLAALTAIPPLPVSRSDAVGQIDRRPTGSRVAASSIPAISVSGRAPAQENHKLTYYVQAGRFMQKPLAYELAAIIGEEIAPASVETAISGNDLVHLVRIGPFREDRDAEVAMSRIKAAGLTDAYIEKFVGS